MYCAAGMALAHWQFTISIFFIFFLFAQSNNSMYVVHFCAVRASRNSHATKQIYEYNAHIYFNVHNAYIYIYTHIVHNKLYVVRIILRLLAHQYHCGPFVAIANNGKKKHKKYWWIKKTVASYGSCTAAVYGCCDVQSHTSFIQCKIFIYEYIVCTGNVYMHYIRCVSIRV